MAEEKELFKTTLMGGYDKDDVMQELQKIKDDAYAEKKTLKDKIAALEKELEEKNQALAELSESVQSKERELLEKDRDIKEKYQSYIDNYDTIGSLIFESKIRAKQIERDAEKMKQQILQEAEAEAAEIREKAKIDSQGILADVQKKAEEKTREEEAKYDAVQEELNNVVELVNRVQRLFMKSYKSIQSIISTMPDSDTDEDMDFLAEFGKEKKD